MADDKKLCSDCELGRLDCVPMDVGYTEKLWFCRKSQSYVIDGKCDQEVQAI